MEIQASEFTGNGRELLFMSGSQKCLGFYPQAKYLRKSTFNYFVGVLLLQGVATLSLVLCEG